MKKQVKIILTLLLALIPPFAEAQFQDLPEGPRGGAFLELTTGKVWLDVRNFYAMPYNDIEALLVNTPYRLATKAEVEGLFSAAGDHFIAAAGESFRCSINFICLSGFYDDSLTGSDPLRVGEAQQVRTFVDEGIGSNVRDDAILRDQPRIGGAWVIQRSPVLKPSASLFSQDFNGDGIDEQIVWRPSTGFWFIRFSGSNEILNEQWGLPGDQPLVGDYDGDHIPDLVVWRPLSSTWYIKTSSSLFDQKVAITQQFGLPGDVPVRADFDGDGRLDLTVWRPSTGNYFYLKSSTAEIISVQWGLPGDIPVGRIISSR